MRSVQENAKNITAIACEVYGEEKVPKDTQKKKRYAATAYSRLRSSPQNKTH